MAVTMLAACNDVPDTPEEQIPPEPAEQEQTQTEEPVEQTPEEPAEPEPTDIPAVEFDISHIPYFGDREKFNLSVEHVLAYAEAIRNAELDLGYWGHFTFDTLYPVLIDVAGDGVPLLLLVEKDDKYGWDIHWNMLFGFADGQLQRITDWPTGVGIATTENENLLVLMREHDFGGRLWFYRVQNGAAEFVSDMRFASDWHQGIFYVGDIELSEDEFFDMMEMIIEEAGYEAWNDWWMTMLDFPIERLMQTGHPGEVYSMPAFEEYLLQSFTRDEAVQIFLDHAVLRRIRQSI